MGGLIKSFNMSLIFLKCGNVPNVTSLYTTFVVVGVKLILFD